MFKCCVKYDFVNYEKQNTPCPGGEGGAVGL